MPAPREGWATARELSTIGRSTQPNQIKAMIEPFVGVQDVALLAQGAPHASTFPIRAVTLELSDGETVRIDNPKTVADAQQYQYAKSGYLPLLEWCRGFSTRHHARPSVWQTALHAGSTDAIAKLCEVLCDPGDLVLCESHTWSTATDGMRQRGLSLKGVEVDAEGIVPSSLERECASAHARGLPLKALYVVPNGSNPCGTTLPRDRFTRIYEICRKYSVIILEDDPYWWLALQEGAPLPGPATSFASIDADGIVVRIDSFAKSIGPGFRLGWLTGPPAIVQAFNAACSTSTHNGSPFAMVALHSMLAHWGTRGLDDHIRGLREEYRRRLRVVLAAMNAHLAGLAHWAEPRVGMFIWLDLSPSGVTDSAALMPRLREHRVLTIPSSVFSVDRLPSPHMRISFSQSSDEDLAAGVQRLATALAEYKQEQQLLQQPPHAANGGGDYVARAPHDKASLSSIADANAYDPTTIGSPWSARSPPSGALAGSGLKRTA